MAEIVEQSFKEMYNLLLAGKKIASRFASIDEAEAFRIKLHKYKHRQDSLLEGLGMQPEEERAVLSFSRTQHPDGGIIGVVQFKQKQTTRYQILVLEDGDDVGLPTEGTETTEV